MSQRPFSGDYVMRETLKHMQKCVTISQHKTMARMSEFEGDSELTKEFLVTISNLNKLSKLIDEIRSENKQLLGE